MDHFYLLEFFHISVGKKRKEKKKSDNLSLYGEPGSQITTQSLHMLTTQETTRSTFGCWKNFIKQLML